MKSLLLETFNFATSWPILLLLVLLVVMLIVSFVSRKKSTEKQAEMLNELKVGDKVVTNAGIYGEIVSMTETDFGKIVLLKSGEGKNVSYINVNMSVILGKDTKKEIVLDEQGNPIDDKVEQQKIDDTAKLDEPKKDEVVEDKTEQPKNEEVVSKPKKPKTSKKSQQKNSETK